MIFLASGGEARKIWRLTRRKSVVAPLSLQPGASPDPHERIGFLFE
jgi:hypothetical protein